MLTQKVVFRMCFELGIEQKKCYGVMILLIDLQNTTVMKYIDVINLALSEMYGKYIRTETFLLPLSL